jgi:hypothetical protein
VPGTSKWGFQGVSPQSVYERLFFFNNFRNGIYQTYTIIYGDETDREQVGQPYTPEETTQLAVDFYYNSLMLCAGDDILKIEPVLKLTLNEVMGYLSYRIDKANKERQKQQNSVG